LIAAAGVLGRGAGDATAELWRRRWLANGLLAGAILLLAVLTVYPPGRGAFYPACPIHRYLGIECPGCGATRALAALLHGRAGEALRLNALFVGLLPLALAGAVECYRRAVRVGEFRWPKVPDTAVYATLAVAVVFTLIRNVTASGI
jgi:hypothetical protein